MTKEEAIQRLYRMGRSHVGIIDENTLADNKALSMAIEALADRPTGWMPLPEPYREDRDEYELATEQREYDITFEPTYNIEDGSM